MSLVNTEPNDSEKIAASLEATILVTGELSAGP